MYNKTIFQRCFPFKGWCGLKNIKYIPRYFRSLHFLIKNGYDEYAVWDTFSWFQTTMRDILLKYKKGHCGSPIIIENYDESKQTENEKQWDEIINRMIFLLGEMDEDTCQKVNPYSDEYDRAYSDFTKKYGFHGEKLKTEAELLEEKTNGYHIHHTMGEVNEYKDIQERHLKEEQNLYNYRAACKDEFLALFAKYYYCLWD